jgi:hypothetical protein
MRRRSARLSSFNPRARTGLAVFFADPYAAWQRGTNENTNGLLRQYFPKRSDLRALTHDDLAQALPSSIIVPVKSSDTNRLMKSSSPLSVAHSQPEFPHFKPYL